MTDKEVIQILKEISEDCSSRSDCSGCKFGSYYGCCISRLPDSWNIARLERDAGILRN